MINNLHFFVQWSAEQNSSAHGWNVNDRTHKHRWRHFKCVLITALLRHNSKTYIKSLDLTVDLKHQSTVLIHSSEVYGNFYFYRSLSAMLGRI